MASLLNLAAGVDCLAGVALLAALFGPAALVAGVGNAVLAGFLTVAGVLFLLAATERTVTVADRAVDLHSCSGLGDVTVGLAILGGLASIPPGSDGLLYTAVVLCGGLSAIGFGVVGLAEKCDVR